MIGRVLALTLAFLLNGAWSPPIEERLYPANVFYYDIYGESQDELRSSMDASGPKDDLGRRRDAFTRWNISWKWPIKDGKPQIESIDINTDVSVILPRPADNLEPNVKREWDRFIEAVVRHEAMHVNLAVSNASKIKKNILKALRDNPNLSYSEANRIGNSILAKIRAFDLKLDSDSESGKHDGVIWPPR